MHALKTVPTAVKQLVELFQRYVGGDLDVFMLHKKLYSLESASRSTRKIRSSSA